MFFADFCYCCSTKAVNMPDLQNGQIYHFVGMLMELLEEAQETKRKPAQEKLDALYSRFPDVADANDFSDFTQFTAPQLDTFLGWDCRICPSFVVTLRCASVYPSTTWFLGSLCKFEQLLFQDFFSKLCIFGCFMHNFSLQDFTPSCGWSKAGHNAKKHSSFCTFAFWSFCQGLQNCCQFGNFLHEHNYF